MSQPAHLFRATENITDGKVLAERLRGVELVGTEFHFGEWKFLRVMGKKWRCIAAPQEHAIDVDNFLSEDEIAGLFMAWQDWETPQAVDLTKREPLLSWLRSLPLDTTVALGNSKWRKVKSASPYTDDPWWEYEAEWNEARSLASEELTHLHLDSLTWKEETPEEETPSMTVLEEAGTLVDDGEREQQYGAPEESFQRIAEFWSTYLGTSISPEQVAAMMILLKVARGVEKRDTVVDICGYSRIIERLLDL